jgi:hypothetical protein
MKFAHAGIVLAAAFQLAFHGSVAAQDDQYVPPEDELAYASMIMEVMFPGDKREQMILDMASAMSRQVASGLMTGPIFEEPGIRAIMDEFLAEMPETLRPIFSKHLPAMFHATAVAYTREFTVQELQDISAFAQTPSGSRYFLNLQKLLSDPSVAAANQEMFRDLHPMQQELGQLVGKQVEEYLIANPDVIELLEKAGVGKAK